MKEGSYTTGVIARETCLCLICRGEGSIINKKEILAQGSRLI